MEIYKILSVLLCYPEYDLISGLDEVKERVNQSGIDCSALMPLIEQLQGQDLIALQENYVQTFDRTPTHALHLFEHLHGEDRARGQALVDLMQEYQQYGFEPIGDELPDYLPLFLEFLSVCEPEKAAAYLGEAIHVIAYIGQKLQNNASVYAGIFQVLEALSPVQAEPLTVPPVRDMDEALEKFGPGVDGIEPLLQNNMSSLTETIKFYPQRKPA